MLQVLLSKLCGLHHTNWQAILSASACSLMACMPLALVAQPLTRLPHRSTTLCLERPTLSDYFDHPFKVLDTVSAAALTCELTWQVSPTFKACCRQQSHSNMPAKQHGPCKTVQPPHLQPLDNNSVALLHHPPPPPLSAPSVGQIEKGNFKQVKSQLN